MSASRYSVWRVFKDGNQHDVAHSNNTGMAVWFAGVLREHAKERCVVGITDNEDGTEVSEKLEQGL